jgi:uncharacterized protein YjbI with pentapeptide repeats
MNLNGTQSVSDLTSPIVTPSPSVPEAPAAQASENLDQEQKCLEKAGISPPKIDIPVSLPVAIIDQNHLDQVLSEHEKWILTVLNPKAPLTSGRANVREANLCGLNLSGRDLRGANFSHAVLDMADMSGANLNGANLTAASLVGAKLTKATCRRTKLDGADLTDAMLDNTDFTHASLVSTKGMNASQAETNPDNCTEVAPQAD